MMRMSVAICCLLVGGCACCGGKCNPRTDKQSTAETSRWSFDDTAVASMPVNWKIEQTNPTTALAHWSVIADGTAPSQPNALALTETANYDGTFNLAVAREGQFKDIDLSVRAKAVKGDEDQGGGPIWRCQDANNYYICRFNPLEANFRVYKVINGKRKQLDSAKIETTAGKWYTIRVTMKGEHVDCYLDGKKLLEADDGAISEAGMVGLWTKADAVTSFDDLVVRAWGR
jgi:hypothetical protein